MLNAINGLKFDHTFFDPFLISHLKEKGFSNESSRFVLQNLDRFFIESLQPGFIDRGGIDSSRHGRWQFGRVDREFDSRFSGVVKIAFHIFVEKKMGLDGRCAHRQSEEEDAPFHEDRRVNRVESATIPS